MGRKKTMRTEREKKAQQDRWRKTRDKVRFNQYNTDPEYRERRREEARASFRKTVGVAASSFKNCVANYDTMETFGQVRQVVLDGKADERLTFTMAELAEVLGGYNPNIVRRWISKDMMPPPVVPANVVTGSFGRDNGVSEMQVYLEEEVRGIMEVMAPQQIKYAYYRADHRDTIDLLYNTVGVVRQELGL